MNLKSFETGTFRCTLCGECCRGNQKVWLNPRDVQRLLAHLSAEGLQELEKRRIVVVEPGEHGVLRPRIRFRSSPAGSFCPFLINDLGGDGILRGRCGLHYTKAKPLVCRLAPLAREVDIDTGVETWKEVPPVSGCPGWGSEPPPDTGVPVDKPGIRQALREELDEETRWFRELAAALPEAGALRRKKGPPCGGPGNHL